MRAILLCIYIAMYLGSYAQGQKNFIDQNYIEVTGTAETNLTPDEIYLNISLNEKDFNGKRKLEDLENDLINSLKELGINVQEDLSISDAIKNVTDYWILGSRENTWREYTLLVREADKLKSIFQKLSSKGIKRISIERVDHSELEKFKSETKKLAIIAAKEKATMLTEAIDQKLGSAIYINEVNGYSNGFSANVISNVKPKYEGFELKESDKSIAFEDIPMRYSVMVRFEILR